MPKAAVKEPVKEPEIFNISELARGFNLDRATVRRRIEAAGIRPVDIAARETRFRLDAKLEEVLLAVDADLESEKLRKMTAEADLKEMEAAERRGELAPVGEFTEIVQTLFAGMHRELTVRLPKKVAGRLARSKTSAQIATVLQREIAGVFDDLRTDFSRFLAEGANGRKV